MFIYSVYSFYSYIIFLIFLGGLLVLFTYICRLASNEKRFYKPIYSSLFLLVLINLRAGYFLILKEEKTIELPTTIFYSFFKVFFYNNEIIYFYIFIYLLLTLFVTVILSKKKEGAIRTKSI